jgi:hypothetical protein
MYALGSHANVLTALCHSVVELPPARIAALAAERAARRDKAQQQQQQQQAGHAGQQQAGHAGQQQAVRAGGGAGAGAGEAEEESPPLPTHSLLVAMPRLSEVRGRACMHSCPECVLSVFCVCPVCVRSVCGG